MRSDEYEMAEFNHSSHDAFLQLIYFEVQRLKMLHAVTIRNLHRTMGVDDCQPTN